MTTSIAPRSNSPLDFSRPVPHDGYAWWYLDAIADDGRHGLTIIAFVGSVFSPRYARARRRGPTSPDAHCALNVVLYGGTTCRWVFSEYARALVRRTSTQFLLGESCWSWDGRSLRIDITERTAPQRQAVRGAITVEPQPLVRNEYTLDNAGRHRWQPLAPSARISVSMNSPALRWQGRAYLDTNHGDAPLAQDFRAWDWCRSHGSVGTDVLYDVQSRDGQRRSLALHFDQDGRCSERPAPPSVALPSTRVWRIARRTQSESGRARVITTLENTPFYARSLIETTLDGQAQIAVHESLSVERFTRPWVQALLPFRMRRVKA